MALQLLSSAAHSAMRIRTHSQKTCSCEYLGVSEICSVFRTTAYLEYCPAAAAARMIGKTGNPAQAVLSFSPNFQWFFRLLAILKNILTINYTPVLPLGLDKHLLFSPWRSDDRAPGNWRLAKIFYPKNDHRPSAPLHEALNLEYSGTAGRKIIKGKIFSYSREGRRPAAGLMRRTSQGTARGGRCEY